MWVQFPLGKSNTTCLTLTALTEMLLWKARGKGAYLMVRQSLPTRTRNWYVRQMTDMSKRKLNESKPHH